MPERILIEPAILKFLLPFPGILRPSDLFMIEIVDNYRMPLFRASIRQFIVYKRTIIVSCQPFCFLFKHLEIAAVFFVIAGILKGYKIRIFFLNVIHNIFFKPTPQV